VNISTDPDWFILPQEEVEVCGFDLTGFSAWVEAAIAEGGTGALEAVSDRLEVLFADASDWMSSHGFRIEALLGDGLLGTRAWPGRGGRATSEQVELDALATSLARRLCNHVAGGPMRSAAACGLLTVAEVGGWNGRHLRLVSGPAVETYHRRLAGQAKRPRPWGAYTAARRPSKLQDAEILHRAMVFVRLAEAPALRAVDRLTYLAQAQADAYDGICEAVTHDDGGPMLRLSFAEVAGARAMLADLPGLVAAEGLDCSVGLADGPVFRARLPALAGTPWTVHGAVVNAAARQAKAAPICSFRAPVSTAVLKPAESGRSVRRGDLRLILDMLRSGATGVVVAAEPGMGKTTLLAQAARALGPGCASLVARPQHGLDPFWLWRGLIDRLIISDPRLRERATLSAAQAAALDALLAARSVVGDLGAESRLLLTAQAIVAVLRVQTVIGHLLIDDLQWADAPSVALIEEVLAARPDMSVVAARRDYGETPVAIPRGAKVVRLAGLPREELAWVLSDAGWRGEPVALDEALRITGGNPLHAVQLAWAQRDAAPRTESDLATLVQARLEHATLEDRAVLRVLAVADRSLTFEDVRALARFGEVELAARGLDGLCERLLLRHDGEGYAVAHRLLAEHIRERLPPSLVEALHARVARRLGASARAGRLRLGRGELANLWRKAGAARRASLSYLAEAQVSLETGDYRSALELFDAGLSLGATLRGARAALAHVGRGQALWAQGFVGRAEVEAAAALAAMDSASPLGPSGRWLAILRGRAHSPRATSALFRTGFLRAELGLFTGNLRGIVGGCLTSSRLEAPFADQGMARSRGFAFLGLACGLMGLTWLARLAYDRAQAADDPRARAYALASEAVWQLARQRFGAARSLLDEADRQLADRVDPHLRDGMLTLRALEAQFSGRYNEAGVAFEALSKANAGGINPLHETWGIYGRAMPLARTGHWDEVLRLVDMALPRLAPLGDAQSTLICWGLRAQAAAALGRRDEALDAVEAALRLAPPPTNFGSLEGFAGPAEAAAHVRRDPAAEPRQRVRAQKLLRPALNAFRRYGRIFPIGSERLTVLEREASKPLNRLSQSL
jgi:tetratricopeptide (TPR) repeat protein